MKSSEAVFDLEGLNRYRKQSDTGAKQRIDRMDEKLRTIRKLLKAKDYVQGEILLREFMEEHPENWDARLLFAFGRQLQGDEDTFRQIHDEAQSHIDANDKEAEAIQASPLWKKSLVWFEWVAVGALLIGGITVTAIMYRTIKIRNEHLDKISRTLYASPEYFKLYYNAHQSIKLPPNDDGRDRVRVTEAEE